MDSLGGGSSSADSTTAVPLLPSGLFADEHGPSNGSPVTVLIHGSMDRGSSFGRVRNRLADERVVTYDRRGYHRSIEAVPPATTLDEHVDDLFSVMAGRRSLLVGHSYGGLVALGAAFRRPELVCAVVAYEAPLPWMPWWPRVSAGSSAAAAGDPEEAAEVFMRRMIGDSRWERLPSRARATRRREGPALAAEMSSMHSRDAPFDLRQLPVPAVIARGSVSLPHHQRSAEVLADLVPNAELVDVEGAGHGAHLTHPDHFAACIRRALELGMAAEPD